MSELGASVRRQRRADAEQSVAAILAAAADLLGTRPGASMAEIAAAAGVTRQTVYAHYRNREALIAAVVDHLTDRAAAAVDAAQPESGTAVAALRRWLDASWGLLERHPVLLQPAVLGTGGRHDETERHLPVVERLLPLVERGQRSGEFDPGPPAPWLVAATIGLGHAAGQEVAAGRMDTAAAGVAFRDSVLRIFGVPDPSEAAGS